MKYLSILVALVGLVLASCSAPLAKDDVVNYTGAIVPAVNLQNEAVEAYKSGFNENYLDDETSLGILNDEALPKFQALAKELKTIDAGLKFQELKDLHALWISGTDATLAALGDVKGALEQKDLVLLKTSDDKIQAAQEKMGEYNTQFLALCKKFDIPVAQ